MRKIIRIHFIVIFLVFLFSSSHIQSQIFSKVYEDVLNGMGVKAYTIVPSFDSSYLLIGAPDTYNYSNITKVDKDGGFIWGKRYEFNSYYHLNLTCATPTYDSAFAIAGSIRNETTNNTDIFLMKINESGDTLWTSTFGVEEFSIYPMSVEQTLDSGFILSGYSLHDEATNRRINVLKFDKMGDLEWGKIISFGNFKNIAYCTKQIADTSYIITGVHSESAQSNDNSFIMNLSEDGLMNWAKGLSLEGTMCINDFILEGNDMLFYYENSNHVGLIRTDSIANIQWNKRYLVWGEDYDNTPSKKLHQTTDNGYIFAYGDAYFWGGVLKTDHFGNIQWHNFINMRVREALETKDHDYLVLGNGPIEGVKGYYQIGLSQLDLEGNGTECVWKTDVQTEEIAITVQTISYDIESLTLSSTPNTISVINNYITVKEGCVDFYGAVNDEKAKGNLSIYPNPNNGIFTIKSLESLRGELVIYNSLGNSIYKSQLSANQQTIDLTAYGQGIYFYEFKNKGIIINSGKFIIID